MWRWFYEEQSSFIENANKINEVTNEYQSFINDYLKKNYKDWVDEWLVGFIEARGDKEKVIIYINYLLKNNPDNLTSDDLFQLANLKNTLVKKEISSIKKSVEKNRNIDFEIVWWTIQVKTLSIKFKWSKLRNKEYQIVDERIISLGDNNYKIQLKRERWNRVHEFIIKYKWWHSITIYDKYWKYISRQTIETKEKTVIKWNRYRKEIYKTPWSLTIDTKREQIKLNIMFNR